jgi:hypothetical protein
VRYEVTQSQECSPSLQSSSMIQETKDTVANLTTIGATGAAVMGVNELLTLVLILTGITLNIVRIVETKRKAKQDK